MIENEQHYSITREQIHKFERSLAKLAECSEDKPKKPLLWQAEKSAVESQSYDLREEIEEYEKLINSSSS